MIHRTKCLSERSSKHPDFTVGDLVSDTLDFDVGGLDLQDSISSESGSAWQKEKKALERKSSATPRRKSSTNVSSMSPKEKQLKRKKRTWGI